MQLEMIYSQGIVTITITPQNDFLVAIDDVFATNGERPRRQCRCQ